METNTSCYLVPYPFLTVNPFPIRLVIYAGTGLIALFSFQLLNSLHWVTFQDPYLRMFISHLNCSEIDWCSFVTCCDLRRLRTTWSWGAGPEIYAPNASITWLPTVLSLQSSRVPGISSRTFFCRPGWFRQSCEEGNWILRLLGGFTCLVGNGPSK